MFQSVFTAELIPCCLLAYPQNSIIHFFQSSISSEIEFFYVFKYYFKCFSFLFSTIVKNVFSLFRQHFFFESNLKPKLYLFEHIKKTIQLLTNLIENIVCQHFNNIEIILKYCNIVKMFSKLLKFKHPFGLKFKLKLMSLFTSNDLIYSQSLYGRFTHIVFSCH